MFCVLRSPFWIDFFSLFNAILTLPFFYFRRYADRSISIGYQQRSGSYISIVLLEDLEKKGQRGDIIDVKRGFARNFLIPRRKAGNALSLIWLPLLLFFWARIICSVYATLFHRIKYGKKKETVQPDVLAASSSVTEQIETEGVISDSNDIKSEQSS